MLMEKFFSAIIRAMKLAVYTIHKTLFEGETDHVIAHTPQGEITVLAHHIPLITELQGPAVIAVDKQEQRQEIPITGGILEVRPNSEVVILANA